ncbi:leucyl/phenylalanyl-tRNA--protein transferase [Myxococcota bacterium]|nr:leucyl/phenylalanyl-tRNA--protein transferase [Myxococcota bacterium]
MFPWPISEDYPMTWFSPDPRAILEPEKLHVSRSLAKLIRQGHFEVSIDRDFEGVIQGCAEPAEGRMSTWITPELAQAYLALHHAGHAHSVEVWRDGELVGGLYGVAIGGLFAGESMFSRESSASKVALARLAEHLVARGFVLLDTQTSTEHLKKMGVVEVPRSAYLKRLKQALELQPTFLP